MSVSRSTGLAAGDDRVRSRTVFRSVWTTTGLTTFGDAVTSVALPLIAIVLFDASAFTVAALIAVEQASWLFLGLMVGVWTDRVRVRRMIQASYAVRGVAIGSVPLAYLFGHLSLTHLFTAAAVTGVAGVFSSVGQLAIVPKIVDRDGLVGANATLSATTTSTSLAGESIGGVLVSALTAPAALVVEAVTSLVSLPMLQRVPDPVPGGAAERARLRSELAAGIRYTLAHPLFRVITLSGAVVNAMTAAQYALIFSFLARPLDVPAAAIGVLVAVNAVGGLIGAALSNRLSSRFGSGRTWRAALLAGPVAGLAIPLAWPGAGLVVFVAASLGLSVGAAIVAVIGGSARQATCPPELIGRMSATSRTLTWGVIPLGGLAGGVLSSLAGVRGALWIVAVGFFAAPLMAWLSPLRRVADLADAESGVV